MKEGPNIALIGSLFGDPTRVNMLTALMGGKALTASELAMEANVSLQTASAHLSKLEAGGLLKVSRQGRHRYFSLAGDEVGAVLESMMGLAALKGHTRVRTGPKDPALRKARICYNHLAGEMGVQLLDSLTANGGVRKIDENLELTLSGKNFVTHFGIELAALEKSRRPLCKNCLDWSARRSHLAGSLGEALLDRFFKLGWARRESGSRIVVFSPSGEAEFHKVFPSPVTRQP